MLPNLTPHELTIIASELIRTCLINSEKYCNFDCHAAIAQKMLILYYHYYYYYRDEKTELLTGKISL